MNNTFAQALAIALTLSAEEKALLIQTLIALGTQGVAPTQASVAQVSAPVTSAPVKERKELAPAKDEELPITIVTGTDKDVVAFTLGYGAGRAGAKAMVRNAGFKWDDTYALEGVRKGAYVGTSAQAKEIGVNKRSKALTVPATWVQAGRDKAAAKEAKKARKSA